MSGRTPVVLGRFPAHLEAARPDKQLWAVTDAIAELLDVLSADLAGVRRAHRLGHADLVRDLRLLGGLHGIDNDDLDVVFTRVAALRALADRLHGDDAGDRDDAADALFEGWIFDWEALAGSPPEPAVPRRGLWAAGGDPPEDAAVADARLALHLRYAVRFQRLVDLVRERIRVICHLHANAGNGTIGTLLVAAANALDLDIDLRRDADSKQALIHAKRMDELELRIQDPFFHSADRFWHATYVIDRLRLERPFLPAPPEGEDQGAPLARLPGAHLAAEEAGFTLRGLAKRLGVFDYTMVEFAQARLDPPIPDATADTVIDLPTAGALTRLFNRFLFQALPPAIEVLGIEENPLRRAKRMPEAAPHGHLFEARRRGFGRTLLRVEVEGVEDFTFGPMVVNRDEGHGIGYFGAVPAGSKLVFREDGRAFLDDADVTSFAFAWQGACFADDADVDEDRDFVFAGPELVDVPARRVAAFAVDFPEGSLDPAFRFPGAGRPVPVPGLDVGITRLAAFVHQAHFSAEIWEGSPLDRRLRPCPPRPGLGLFDQSVYAAGPALVDPVAANITLSWLEHEAYALRVIIPKRFKALDALAMSGDPPVKDRVAAALERFRPAGVQIRVEYMDDAWVLGEGHLPEDALGNPILMLRGGTVVAPPPEEDEE